MQDLTENLVDLFPVDTAGLLLGDHRGELRLTAATSDETRVLELLAPQVDEGPLVDTFTSGHPTLVPHLAAHATVWPSFVPAATTAGFAAAHALPLRLRDRTIGVIGFFAHAPGALTETDVVTAQALADVATVGVLHQRTSVGAAELTEQLRSALHTRVVIEQAKGVVAEHGNVDIGTADLLIRGYARNHGTSLRTTAAGVITGTITTAQLTGA